MKAKDNDSFFTQATNSLGAVSSGVDIRTGIYSVHLTLAMINANKGLGPDFHLLLRYSPLSSENYGFGKGFSIGVTSYNRQTKTLKLYTGEQYKISESDDNENGVHILGQKVCDFTFKKITENEYLVSYKDGKKEYLKGASEASDIKITHNILSHTRQKLCFDWDYSWSRGLRLISVYNDGDQPGTLISIEYIEESKSTLHLFKDTKEAYDVELIFFNNYLTAMKSFSLNENSDKSTVQEWGFYYTEGSKNPMFRAWGNWLNKVIYPGGMTERATYNNTKGHSFPSTAKLPDLPYVTTFERFLDSKMSVLATKSEYEFSRNNFLGGNTGYGWGNQGVDENGLEYIYTLWKLNPDYTYTCTETRINDSKVNKHRTVVTSTYNIFHLLTSETASDDTGSIINNTEYNALTNVAPTNQPANFRLPRKTSRTLKNRDGQDMTICTETHYDNYANLISKSVKKQTDGTLIEPYVEIEYYAGAEEETINGIALCCPADPDGFTKFIKSITLTPVSTKNKEESKKQYFSYKDIGSGVILKIRESQVNTLNTITTSFFYDTNAHSPGRATREEYVLTRDNNEFKSYTTHNYTDELNTYTKHTTYISHDNKKLSTNITLSNYTGRTMKQMESTGTVTEYEYDYSGRVISKKTTATDSAPLHERYTYYLNTEDKYPFKMLHTRADGVRTLQELDSFARLSQKRISADDDGVDSFSRWPVTEKFEYDLLGHKSKAHRLDYVKEGKDYKKVMDKHVTYKYDIWGNECQRKTSEGLTESIIFDPVTMTNTYAFEDAKGQPLLGAITEQINHLGSQLKITLYSFDKEEVSHSTFSRDGWNRVVSKTNANEETLLQNFDCYDRIINETRFDGNQLIYNYAASSTENHLESLELSILSDHTEKGQNTILPTPVRLLIGKKRYDGLGRLTENKAFNRRWSYEYDSDNSIIPDKIVDPSGVLRCIDYTDIQGPKVKEVYVKHGNVKHSVEEFNYNKITGSVLKGITNACTVIRTYHKPGYIKSDSISYQAGTAKGIEYQWSLGGLLYSITDAQGFTQEHIFDEFGRVIQVKGNKADITYKYDELSRVTFKAVSNKDSNHFVETIIRYDASGREVYRKVHDTLHTANTRIMKQVWDKLGRLVTKEWYRIADDEETKLIAENYTYNANGSVSRYECIKTHDDGLPHMPADKYGNTILKESFDYDALGNVIQNTRHFLPSDGDDTSRQQVNTCVLIYDTTDRTRLAKITHTHQDYPPLLKFEYDLNGNMTVTGENKISYDELGRINKIDEIPCYYDAFDRLVKTGETERLYAFRQLRNETGESVNRTSLFVGHHGAESSHDEIVLTACDGKNSCIYAATGTKSEWQSYSVYGESHPSQKFMSFTGFNGENRESALDAYVLGGGYRCYSPSLMRFITPDSPFNSPYGIAGLNPYTYCIGDPVNNADPTGQISWQGWVSMAAGGIGLMMTLLTGGLSIAAASGILATSLAIGATAASLVSGVTAIAGTAISGISPDATRILRWVSLGTGLLSFSSGVAGMAQGLYKAMRDLGLRTTLATMGFTSRVGLALNTVSYATATVSYGISLTKRILDQTTLAQSRLNTILGHISFGVGIISDAASISHFALSKAMPRAFSWDVPQSATMDAISLRSLTPGSNSLDANTSGSYVYYSEMLIPQINNFFLHIPLQPRT